MTSFQNKNYKEVKINMHPYFHKIEVNPIKLENRFKTVLYIMVRRK